MLAGILVEIAKHTFSVDNFKISRICDQGREQFFVWHCSPLFSLSQPNSLGISFDITRQLLSASRILTLDAPVTSVFFDLQRTHAVFTLLRNTFRTNIDEALTVVRKTERDKETYKFVCFLA